MPPTALKVKKASPGKHADIHGLYLIVQPSGTRSWMLRCQYKGRRRDFGLGPAHDVPLAEARVAAMDVRRMIRAGLDPVVERGLKRPSRPSFEVVARKCYQRLRKGLKDRRNASWIASFDNHVFPLIGTKRVDEIDSKTVLAVMEPIWTTIPDSAQASAADRCGAGLCPHQGNDPAAGIAALGSKGSATPDASGRAPAGDALQGRAGVHE